MTNTLNTLVTAEEPLPVPLAAADFYLHANHDWLQEHEIPDSESRWGSFDMLAHKTYDRLKSIAELAAESSQDAERGSNEQLVGDFYRSGMGMETRNALGLEPLRELRSVIEGVTDGNDALNAMAALRLKGVSTFFYTYTDEDLKIAGSNALYLEQGGLGLPDRDYYLSDDESKQEIRDKYKAYMSTLFQMSGRTKTEAEAAAEAAYGVEYALAEASLPKAELREYDKNYFKFTPEQAAKEFPDVDLGAFFETLGVPDIKDFVVTQPQFMQRVGQVLQTGDINAVKDYLEFTLLDNMAGSLSEDFVAASFGFNNQVLYGIKEPKPLWKRTILALQGTRLTQAIGPLYCEQYFNPADKAKVTEIVGDVREAFRDNVEKLDWMDQPVKELTWQKLDQITFNMGFPDQWEDVSGVDLSGDAYVANRMALAEFSLRSKLAKLEEPYDRSEWHMSPTVVNACADLKRTMTFPAAILQNPFYDSSRDDAYNYGAIGAVIGHELSHFFDDQGCKFDLDGNLNDWWTEEVKEQFKSRAQKFVEYFGKLAVNGANINGQLTLGENIADVAGLDIAYAALKKYLARTKAEPIVDGLTPEQRFFTGYARVWAQKIRPELAASRILTDPHSPALVRVNGVLAVNRRFHAAFDVTPDDTMYTDPGELPGIW